LTARQEEARQISKTDKRTQFQQVDDDPNPIDVDFHFPCCAEVDPEPYASDTAPFFPKIPN